jgi:hypothetical protein
MGADGFHECGVNGHTRRVRDGLLFCLFHWRRVTPVTQQRVYAAWRAYNDDQRSLEAIRAYREAVQAAIAEAETKEKAAQ